MKKITMLFVAAAALLGVTSCNTAAIDEVSLGQTTVTASFASSRTTLDGVKTLWSAEDKIEVNGVEFTLTQGAGEAVATFASNTPIAVAELYTAKYPAGVTAVPTVQNAVAGSFDPQAALAEAAGATTENLVFEHRHALLKFALAAPASKVEVLGYTLQGAMEAEKNYYVAVPAAVYEGLTAKVDDVEVRNTYNTITLENGKILNLGTLPNAAAEAVGIRTAADLVDFAAEVAAQIAAEQTPDGGKFKDANGVVNILANIDMKDVAWTPISNFSGTLEGNNHTIDNLVVATTESSAAMFKNLSDATIQNLVFGKGCSFSASGLDSNKNTYVAAVVARILTGSTLKNIKSYATLSGGNQMGGICGGADLKMGSSLFENCTNCGSITYPAQVPAANVMAGGICGINEKEVEYRNCTNEGDITILSTGGNKYNIIGGIVATGSDYVMYNCKNTGNLKYDVRGANNLYFGGICGRNHRNNVENCSNTGTMTITSESECNSVYAGGLFGSVEGTSTEENHFLKCHNSADITVACANKANVLIGGIVGYFREDGLYMDSCTNSGDITYSTTISNSMAGGIMGYSAIKNSDSVTRDACIYKCENTGNIKFYHTVQQSSWMKLAGIAGATSDNQLIIDGCINRGTITMDYLTRSNPGGIISECKSDVKNCKNYGTIYTTSTHVDYYSGTGGIVSRMEAARTISGCINYGTIVYAGLGFTNPNPGKGVVGQGGIVGLMNHGTIDNCTNYGAIVGNDYDAAHGKAEYVNAKGAIAGWAGASSAVTIKNCKVGGALGSCVEADKDFGAAKATAITAEDYAEHIYGGNAGKGVTISDCAFAVSE